MAAAVSREHGATLLYVRMWSTNGMAESSLPSYENPVLLPTRVTRPVPVGSERQFRNYGEINPIVRNHVSTSSGHLVIGYCVRRNPKTCLPSAYRCISTGTPALFNAM